MAVILGRIDRPGKRLSEPSVSRTASETGEVGFIAEEGNRACILSERLSERPHDLRGGVDESVKNAHETRTDVVI
jgi:hypothetical protein